VTGEGAQGDTCLWVLGYDTFIVCTRPVLIRFFTLFQNDTIFRVRFFAALRVTGGGAQGDGGGACGI